MYLAKITVSTSCLVLCFRVPPPFQSADWLSSAPLTMQCAHPWPEPHVCVFSLSKQSCDRPLTNCFPGCFMILLFSYVTQVQACWYLAICSAPCCLMQLRFSVVLKAHHVVEALHVQSHASNESSPQTYVARDPPLLQHPRRSAARGLCTIHGFKHCRRISFRLAKKIKHQKPSLSILRLGRRPDPFWNIQSPLVAAFKPSRVAAKSVSSCICWR